MGTRGFLVRSGPGSRNRPHAGRVHPELELDGESGGAPSRVPRGRHSHGRQRVTAGDGAAALVLGDLQSVTSLGVQPLARIAASAVSGVDPRLYGIGPVEAAAKALKRAGIGWSDVVATVELNEAFAAQALACLAEWPELDPKVVESHRWRARDWSPTRLLWSTHPHDIGVAPPPHRRPLGFGGHVHRSWPGHRRSPGTELNMTSRSEQVGAPAVLTPDPAYDVPEYRSSGKRAPRQPLHPLPLGATERHGPTFGHLSLTAVDADLTRQHAREPIGERILVSGRVLDGAGRPVRQSLVEIWQANADRQIRSPGRSAPSAARSELHWCRALPDRGQRRV